MPRPLSEMPKMTSYQTVPSQTLLFEGEMYPTLRLNQEHQYDRCLAQDHCWNKHDVQLHFSEATWDASRRIISVFLYVVLREIAAPYTCGSFADAEVNADRDFG